MIINYNIGTVAQQHSSNKCNLFSLFYRYARVSMILLYLSTGDLYSKKKKKNGKRYSFNE